MKRGKEEKNEKKFVTKALGCRLNQYEMDIISSQLKNNGLKKVDSNGDIVIINTCTVTSIADRKTRKEIRKLIKLNPEAYVVVTGCYAETNKDDIKRIEGVDLIIPNIKKESIVEILANKNIIEIQDRNIINFNIDRSRPYIKIQDGCNHLCSYCKVRIARGKSRSVDINRIIESAKFLFDSGYEEIVLTGVNIGDYNWEGKRLSYLLKKLIDIPNGKRIRLSSIEPTDLTDELIEVLSDQKICSYFHIPLQSGSNRILKLMKRPYNREVYEKKIKKLYSIKKNVIIGADVIVGFPTEKEEDFLDTFQLLQNNNIYFLHIFRYSPREGTEAFNLKNDVSEDIKRKRANILKEYRRVRKEELFKNLINKKMEVLVEQRFFFNRYLSSISDNYINILIPKEEAIKSVKKIMPVIVKDYKNGFLYGKIMD